jgi:small subunit ribosomal protein S6
MVAPAPLYDLMLLLDTSAPEEQRKKVLSDVESMVSSSGTIVGNHDWGTRALAYEIRHKGDAEYHLLQFEGSPTVPAALDRYLRITDGVTRFRVIKLRAGTPAPPEPRPERTEAPAEAPSAA